MAAVVNEVTVERGVAKYFAQSVEIQPDRETANFLAMPPVIDLRA